MENKFKYDMNTKRISYGKMKNYIIEDKISEHLETKESINGYELDGNMEVATTYDFIPGHGYLDDFGYVWIYSVLC